MRYPIHLNGPTLEEFAVEYFETRCAESSDSCYWHFLPILWSNLATRVLSGQKSYDRLSDFLSNLDPQKRYFAISNLDDGLAHADVLRKPDNLVLFNAGGQGDVPIPLITESVLPDVTGLDRDIFASFRGSMGIGELVYPVRKSMFSELEDKPGFHLSVVENTLLNPEVSTDYVADYFSLLNRSVFSLCPSGYGKTSYRLYESLKFGAIPVYIFDDKPWLPFESQISWEKFCVFCSVKDLHKLPTMLRQIDPSTQIKMVRDGKQASETYFSYQATMNFIAQWLESHV